ncbi:hypothetical protein MXB_3831 [Myxobolus squamalis]|nr:hypothetical protein MXB_3831 [Myxobolus squamalis]
MQPNDYNIWCDKFGPEGDMKVKTEIPNDASTFKINKPLNSFGDNFGLAMLTKYGWKQGQGLGKNQQGISSALEVKKIGKNSAVIIGQNSRINLMKDRKIENSSPIVLIRV